MALPMRLFGPIVRLILLLQCILLISSCLLAAGSSSKAEDAAAASDNATVEDNDDSQKCGLYLALSSTSTSDTNIWGVYAGKALPAHAVIHTDVGILVPHFRAATATEVVEFLEEIIWVPAPAGAKFAVPKSVAAIPGAGALSAFHGKLQNAGWASRGVYQRRPVVEDDGKPHPGRGAVTDYYNVTVETTLPVKAGTEIFLDFGDNWAEEESEDDLTTDDFKKLDETVQQMIAYFTKYDHLEPETKQRVYHFLLQDILTAAIGGGKAKKVQGILPLRPDDLPKVIEAGGTFGYSQPQSQRSIEWLEQYGRCMDNIRMGTSDIPYTGGRGAVATRHIVKGGLVAPIPLVHLVDKSVLDIPDVIVNDGGEYVRQSDKILSRQLLLNYVYSHPESTMAFYPTGAIVSFINHSGDAPNAVMRWSTHPSHERSWLQLDPSELEPYVGLLMEIVALRDIQEGEEILLDYGHEWQKAWTEHVQQWEERVRDGTLPAVWPQRAVQVMEEYRIKNLPYRTSQELETDPYPAGVELKAFLLVKSFDTEGTLEDPSPWGAEDGKMYHADHMRPCEVIERYVVTDDKSSASSFMYLVLWKSSKGKTVYVKDVPHEAFAFVDVGEAGDQFVNGSFRHHIGIPDDIFPKAWKNI